MTQFTNTKLTRVLYIDGDITYSKAYYAHRKMDEHLAENAIRDHIDRAIEDSLRELKAEKAVIVLSCPIRENFRRKLYEPYKNSKMYGNRPPLLDAAKDYLIDQYEWLAADGIEADDLLGILATEGENWELNEERIIVSQDKDLKQIPCKLYNPDKKGLGIRDITLEQANEYFYIQWLSGDAGDCYHGIPGIGPTTAKEIIEKAKLKAKEEDDLVRYYYYLEQIIFAEYAWHHLNEEYALTQARLARLLRSGDYKDGKIKLWEPTNPFDI